MLLWPTYPRRRVSLTVADPNLAGFASVTCTEGPPVHGADDKVGACARSKTSRYPLQNMALGALFDLCLQLPLLARVAAALHSQNRDAKQNAAFKRVDAHLRLQGYAPPGTRPSAMHTAPGLAGIPGARQDRPPALAAASQPSSLLSTGDGLGAGVCPSSCAAAPHNASLCVRTPKFSRAAPSQPASQAMRGDLRDRPQPPIPTRWHASAVALRLDDVRACTN